MVNSMLEEKGISFKEIEHSFLVETIVSKD